MYPSSKHILYLTYSIGLSALWDNAYINKMLSTLIKIHCERVLAQPVCILPISR